MADLILQSSPLLGAALFQWDPQGDYEFMIADDSLMPWKCGGKNVNSSLAAADFPRANHSAARRSK